jgi:type III secretion protein U
MSNDDGTGEKTEQPTEKRLRDARRDGDVAKSHDLSQTATTLVWMLVLVGMSGYFADRVSALVEHAWSRVSLESPNALREIGWDAALTVLLLTVIPLTLVGVCGALVEFLQAGAVFAPKRIAPQGSRLSPASGLQRIVSMDNLFEIVKSLAKTAILAVLIVLLIRQHLPDILELPAAGIAAYVGLDRRLILSLCAWIVVLFAFVSIGDRLFQGFAHRKRLRMSKHEVRRERKEEDGDPHTRGQRKRLHRRWATQNARDAAREATALVVNPTHIAVAILYDVERTAVPMITAKGEGNLAQLMRREAEEAGVPVIRDVPLARALNFYGEEDDLIPEEYFEAVAEVIAWAERLRRPASPDGAGNAGVYPSSDV